MPREDVQFFLLVTALAMFLTPVTFKAAPVFSRFLERFTLREHERQPPVSSASFFALRRRVERVLPENCAM